ncbi:MAG: carboxypeptidase regulatory-like domain-containing protein, partial [Erythrobacter sp.]|nr:carboxypeptidase regulatory-like domain-containing protein [Erythrobacter sp.]
MKIKYLLAASVVSLSAAATFTAPVQAQTITSAIEGNVTDEAGNPLAGATATIVDTRTNREAIAVTDASGNFRTVALQPGGPYTVTITGVPAGYTNTFGGPSQVTTLESGETDGSLDFGFYLGASIGNFVFDDLDGDGAFDAGEPGFDAVTEAAARSLDGAGPRLMVYRCLRNGSGVEAL